jgi:galacturan 1,4-alpha-galacturonidase
MYITLALFASLATLAVARLSCKVPSLGGGRDDGPAINAAFQRCAKNGKITLDKYYLVDSLLLTTELDDVEIELSGMRESYLIIDDIVFFDTLEVQYSADIAKWSPQSYFLQYQNALVYLHNFILWRTPSSIPRLF